MAAAEQTHEAAIDGTENIPSQALELRSKMQTEIIDPRGDLKLQNGSVILLVSSNVLMLTSTYFRTLLKEDGGFLESQQKPDRDDPPVKLLNDDDTEAFRLMCKILHYRSVQEMVSVEQMKRLADVCNYYGCTPAVSLQAGIWAKHSSIRDQAVLTKNQLVDLLISAYVFNVDDVFSRTSVDVAAALTGLEIQSFSAELLPEDIKDGLADVRRELYKSVFTEVESALQTVTRSADSHIITEYMLCRRCGRQKPLAARRCKPCGATAEDLLPTTDHCDLAKRLSMLFIWLDMSMLWPLSACEIKIESFNDRNSHRIDTMSHYCAGGEVCAFKVAENKLLNNKTLYERASGLQLSNYVSEEL